MNNSANLNNNNVSNTNGLGPVFSLAAGTTFADNGADGTALKPYVVE